MIKNCDFFCFLFYFLFFFCTYYLARKAAVFLRGNFSSGPNQFIWICLLIGAVFFFTKREKANLPSNPILQICCKAGDLLIFMAAAILGFCTQELERLNLSCQAAGLWILLLSALACAVRYYFHHQKRALDLRDHLLLFLYAAAYYYWGFVINFRNAHDPTDYIIYNILILYVVLLLVLFITANLNHTLILGAILNPIWILIHYFVYNLRGSIFVPGDLRAAGTAATVADQYNFHINSDIWGMCLFSLVVILLALNGKTIKILQHRLRYSLLGSVILMFFVIGWYRSDFITNMGLPYAVFKQDDWYDQVGYTLGFIEIMKKSEVAEPEGYSEETILALSADYAPDSENISDISPNIIVIMNEAFADIGDLGTLNTNADYMPYYHSLTTDRSTAVGRTLVSVIGGRTCQSEYEFLTGNSCEYFSTSTPYVTELNGNIYSLVSTLKDQGYYTIATHPNVGTNWRRNVVYDYMQFDEKYFIEDYSDPELVREYVSDRDIYKNILRWLDSKEETSPKFVFAVTMQNHGGYDGTSIRNGESLPILRNSSESPDGIDQYLSLIYESDQALEDLISQVDKLETPTIVVMFGDHFPMMTDEQLASIKDSSITYDSELEESQSTYATPYIIHANYDVDLSQIPEYMSLNYLSSYLLEACGMEMPAYNEFLLDMAEEIPALNAFGFLTADGNWYQYTENYDDIYRTKIKEYNMLQYNNTYEDAIQEMFALDQ